MRRQKQNILDIAQNWSNFRGRLCQETNLEKMHKQRPHQSLLPNTKKKSLI